MVVFSFVPSELNAVMPPLQGQTASQEGPRYSTYPSSHSINRGRYITSNDPRGYVPVYEYSINNQWIMMDTDDGYVLWTSICKALGKTKADIVKMVESQPDLAPQLRRVKGGFLKIQGTWIPHDAAETLARKIAWPIRDDLVPLFGPDFPNTCLNPNHPEYGQIVVPKRKARRNPQTSLGGPSSSPSANPRSPIYPPSNTYPSSPIVDQTAHGPSSHIEATPTYYRTTTDDAESHPQARVRYQFSPTETPSHHMYAPYYPQQPQTPPHTSTSSQPTYQVNPLVGQYGSASHGYTDTTYQPQAPAQYTNEVPNQQQTYSQQYSQAFASPPREQPMNVQRSAYENYVAPSYPTSQDPSGYYQSHGQQGHHPTGYHQSYPLNHYQESTGRYQNYGGSGPSESHIRYSAERERGEDEGQSSTGYNDYGYTSRGDQSQSQRYAHQMEQGQTYQSGFGEASTQPNDRSDQDFYSQAGTPPHTAHYPHHPRYQHTQQNYGQGQ